MVFVGVLGASNYTFVDVTWSVRCRTGRSRTSGCSCSGGRAGARDPGQREGRGPEGQPLRAGSEPHEPRTGHPLRNHRAAGPAARSAGRGEGGSRSPTRRALDHGAAAQPDVLLARRTPRGHRAPAGCTNERSFEKTEGSRRSWFEDLDRPTLRPLPAARYEYADWRKAARVNIDYHIQADRALLQRSPPAGPPRGRRSDHGPDGGDLPQAPPGRRARPDPQERRTRDQPGAHARYRTVRMRDGHLPGSSPGAARPDRTRPRSSNASSRADPTPNRATAPASG